MMTLMTTVRMVMTLMQRQRDKGRVTRMTMIETPVRKKAAGPGPSGAAGNKIMFIIVALHINHLWMDVAPWCCKWTDWIEWMGWTTGWCEL